MTFCWTFALLKFDGVMETRAGLVKAMEPIYHNGPMPPAKIGEILGREHTFVQMGDGAVLAMRKDQENLELPVNQHYPDFRGNLLLGKLVDEQFVGAMGVPIGETNSGERTPGSLLPMQYE